LIVAALAAAALLGATSSVHCAAMCGPLAAVGCSRSREGRGQVEGGALFGYLGARALGYGLAGSVAGTVGAPLAAGRFGEGLRVGVAVLVGVFLVTRAVGWLVGREGGGLVQLRRGGPGWFERLAPYLPRKGAALGFATTFFPCGVLLTGLLSAAASGSTALGAGMMVAFALASSPLLLLPTFVGARARPLLARPLGRRVAAAGLVLLAAWIVVPPVAALAKPKPSPATCCDPQPRAP